MAKIVFIRYDGVLHEGGAHMLHDGVQNEYRGVVLLHLSHHLSNALRSYPSVKIVLSTHWTRYRGFDETKNYLPIEELRNRVIGATIHVQEWNEAPHLLLRPCGPSVLSYVADHSLSSWVAIDHDPVGYEGHLDRVVICKSIAGLGDPEALGDLETKLKMWFGPV
jgi:HAD domain in Swiss Army Knife RNA repair proteins